MQAAKMEELKPWKGDRDTIMDEEDSDSGNTDIENLTWFAADGRYRTIEEAPEFNTENLFIIRNHIEKEEGREIDAEIEKIKTFTRITGGEHRRVFDKFEEVTDLNYEVKLNPNNTEIKIIKVEAGPEEKGNDPDLATEWRERHEEQERGDSETADEVRKRWGDKDIGIKSFQSGCKFFGPSAEKVTEGFVDFAKEHDMYIEVNEINDYHTKVWIRGWGNLD